MRGYFQSTHNGFLNRRSHAQLLKVNLVIHADFYLFMFRTPSVERATTNFFRKMELVTAIIK